MRNVLARHELSTGACSTTLNEGRRRAGGRGDTRWQIPNCIVSSVSQLSATLDHTLLNSQHFYMNSFQCGLKKNSVAHHTIPHSGNVWTVCRVQGSKVIIAAEFMNCVCIWLVDSRIWIYSFFTLNETCTWTCIAHMAMAYSQSQTQWLLGKCIPSLSLRHISAQSIFWWIYVYCTVLIADNNPLWGLRCVMQLELVCFEDLRTWEIKAEMIYK